MIESQKAFRTPFVSVYVGKQMERWISELSKLSKLTVREVRHRLVHVWMRSGAEQVIHVESGFSGRRLGHGSCDRWRHGVEHD